MRTVIAIILLFILNPVLAQIPHTWVASNGVDTAACTRAAPCATFGAALAQTSAGGIVTCIDDGAFGGPAVTNISQSVTVNCEGKFASLEVSSDNGINITAVPPSIVTLKGLSIIGLSNACLIGINDQTGATLQLHAVSVDGCRGGSGIGLNFAPPAGTAGKLFVSDSSFTNNTKGVYVYPDSTGTATASFAHVKINGNDTGMTVSGTSAHGGAPINVVLSGDSEVIGNSGNALVSTSGGTQTVLRVDRTVVMGNGGSGLYVNGPNSFFVISATIDTLNGIAMTQVSPGIVYSYGNNYVNGNGVSGSFPSQPTWSGQ